MLNMAIKLPSPVLSFEGFQETKPTDETLSRLIKLNRRFVALSQEDSQLSADVLQIAMDAIEDSETPDGPVKEEGQTDGNSETLSTEGWVANTKSILMRAGKMVIDFIAKVVRWIMNYISDYERSIRMRKTNAGKQLNELSTKLSRGNKDFTVEVGGDGLTMLSYGDSVPNGPGEVAVAWRSFVRETYSPFADWLKNVGDVMGAASKVLSKIFNARDVMEPDAAMFDELANIAWPQAPKGWKRIYNWQPVNGGEVMTTPGKVWGNPETTNGMPLTVVAGGVLAGLNSEYAQPLAPEEIDGDQSITLTAPTMLEFAKCGVGALDLLSDVKSTHSAILDLGKKVLSGYTYRFIDTNEDGDPQELERRNKIINDVMGTVSYAMNITSVMSDYLLRFQMTVYLLAKQVIDTIEKREKDELSGK